MQDLMAGRRWAVIAGILTTMLSPSGVVGADLKDQIAELKAVVSQLQRENQDLRNRLSEVERRLAAAVTKGSVASTPVSSEPSKQAWRKLRRGMSAAEVSALLGEPEKVTALSAITCWNYPCPKGITSTPYVYFHADNMTVYQWQEP